MEMGFFKKKHGKRPTLALNKLVFGGGGATEVDRIKK